MKLSRKNNLPYLEIKINVFIDICKKYPPKLTDIFDAIYKLIHYKQFPLLVPECYPFSVPISIGRAL